MADIEKAIRILEGSYKSFVLRHNGELITVNELLALLKAQEPLAPVQDGCGALICGNQTLGCGVVGMYDVETGKVTEKISNYCAFCGRKVKWND